MEEGGSGEDSGDVGDNGRKDGKGKTGVADI
jgi:hypothetical protein